MVLVLADDDTTDDALSSARSARSARSPQGTAEHSAKSAGKVLGRARSALPDTSVEPPKRRCCCCRAASKPNAVINKLINIEAKMKGENFKVDSRWSWVVSFRMHLLFSLMIFLNAACIGIDIVSADEDGQSHPVMMVLESIFLVTFWIEIVLRVLAFGLRKFCTDPWGPFDLAVTILGSLDAWVLTPFVGSTDVLAGLSALRVMRLLRLARLLRVFRHFKQLTQLVKILTGAFQSLTWVSLLLFMAVYIFVVLTLTLLKGNEDSSPDLSRLTQHICWTIFFHLMVVTSEGYLEYLVWPTVQLTTLWYLYWTVMLIVLNFFMVNLMVGIIVQRTLVQEEDDEEDYVAFSFVHEAESFKRTLLTLFEISDASQDGVIDTNDLTSLLMSEQMEDVMKAFGIRTDVPYDFMLDILGFKHERYVTFKRFYEACVRICGTSGDIRTFMLQHDVLEMTEEVSKDVKRIMERLGAKADQPVDPASLIALPDLSRGSDKSGGSSSRSSYRKRVSISDADSPGALIMPGSPARSAPHPPPPAPAAHPPPTSPAPGRFADDAKRFGTPPPYGAFTKGAGLPTRGGLPAKDDFSPSVSRPVICNARLGAGLSENFTNKTQLAKKRLSVLERRQEEMLLTLGELRKVLLGNCGSVCCPNGHLLLPLGTTLYPVGCTEYRHWSCDAAHEPGACRNGPTAGSHLTKWRRYHCATCRYDLCEVCYQHRLWGGDPPQKQGVFAPKPPAVAPPVLSQPMYETPRPVLPPVRNRV